LLWICTGSVCWYCKTLPHGELQHNLCTYSVTCWRVCLKLFKWKSNNAFRVLLSFRSLLKVKVKFSLEQATKAQRGSRFIALFFLQLRRWVINATPWPLYPRKRPGTYYIGGCVAPGPFSTCEENFTPTGIRSPNCPARNESLY
jgi:hypothetical protein